MNRLLPFGKDRSDILTGVGLFVFTFLLYMRTLAPTVTAIYDDSLEFPLVVYRLAIAHPTGYPLYILLGKLFTALLPVGDVAYRLHIFSALCSAATVTILFVAMRRLGLHLVAAVGGGLFLAVSPVFWSQALIAEVYALNALFVALMLALAIEYWRGVHRPLLLEALVFVMGLSLTHHRTIVLLFPPLLLHLVLVQRLSRLPSPLHLPMRELGKLAVLFCLSLLLYLYIPLRGLVTTSLDGTYQNTWPGFVSWITASSYTTFLRDNPLQREAMDAATYLGLLRQQFGFAGLVLAALGGAWLALRRRLVFLLLMLSWMTFVFFVALYRVADAPVFLIPSFIMVALAVGGGLHTLIAGIPPDARAFVRLLNRDSQPASAISLPMPSWRLANIRLGLVTALLILLIAHSLRQNTCQVDRSDDWAVHNYAVDVLSQPLEEKATIVGILGEVTLLDYFRETRALRPDVQTIAADRDDQRLSVVNALATAGQPVYLTRPLPRLPTTYGRQSVGPLIRVTMPSSTMGSLQPTPSPAQVVFDGRIALLSYRLAGLSSDRQPQSFAQPERPGEVEVAGRLRLTLTWQALQPVAKDYRVTIRLKSPTGRLLWQRDGGPVNDGYPMSAWRAGETIEDVHDLVVPVGLPPGLYDLEIGLYDMADLQLLPVAGRSGLFTIGPLTVLRPQTAVDLDKLPATDRRQAGDLAVPRGRLDYSLEQLGIRRIVRSNFENEYVLYGHSLFSAPLVTGQTVDVTLLWQALRKPADDRVVFVQMVDKTGKVWASQESQPADGLYPTSHWQRDDIVRDIHTLLIPADTPNGQYRLQAGMYDALGRPLTVLHLTRRSLDHVDLGPVELRSRPRSQEIPPIPATVNARIGRVALLLGYGLGAGEPGASTNMADVVARPGDTVNVRLVWQAAEQTRTSYTVFVHLLGTDGRVISQDDTIPGRGTLPTTSWLRGEVLVDTYIVTIPVTAAAGLYSLEIGLYDATTGARLPVWDAQGAAVGDRLLLPKVRVERAP